MKTEVNSDNGTIVDALFAQAQAQPDKIIFSECIDNHRRSLTYSQLSEQITKYASKLQEQGIGKGSKVLILTRPNLQLAEILFALFRLGAVPIIIDPAIGLTAVLKSIRRVQPNAIICKPLIKFFLPLFSKTLASVTTAITTTQLQAGRLETCARLNNIDKPVASDLAAIFFTSGSTDLPKPVEWTHRQLKAHIDSVPNLFELNGDDVDLALFPLSMLITPVLGICCHVPDYRKINPKSCDTEYLYHLLQQVNATVCFASPVIWRQLSLHCLALDKTLPSIKYAVSGGAPISAKVAQRVKKILPNGRFYSPYGATEASPISYAKNIEFKPDYGVKLGRLVKGLQLNIKPHSDIILPNNSLKVGEIMLAGDLVSKHYHLAPELDAQAKVIEQKEGLETCWHLTGDLAVLDETGELWSLGRLKDVIRIDNRSLFTTLAEEPINLMSEVEHCAFVAVKHTHLKQRVYLVVEVCNKMDKQQRQQLDKVIRGQLDKINYPIDDVRFIKKMPVDKRHHSKIDRPAVKKWLIKN
ncbi:MAG: AMP-binding protein [Pseudomonadales bacterium]|nr:AMP-binding protein [Pseudomonadales bacterium]